MKQGIAAWLVLLGCVDARRDTSTGAGPVVTVPAHLDARAPIATSPSASSAAPAVAPPAAAPPPSVAPDASVAPTRDAAAPAPRVAVDVVLSGAVNATLRGTFAASHCANVGSLAVVSTKLYAVVVVAPLAGDPYELRLLLPDLAAAPITLVEPDQWTGRVAMSIQRQTNGALWEAIKGRVTVDSGRESGSFDVELTPGESGNGFLRARGRWRCVVP